MFCKVHKQFLEGKFIHFCWASALPLFLLILWPWFNEKTFFKNPNQTPNSVSHTCTEANFFISLSAFPKERADVKTQLGPAKRMGQRGETYACAAPACTSVRILVMILINVSSWWDFGAWGSRCAPEQKAELEVQAGMVDGRALARLGPGPRLLSCSLHLHSGSLDLLIIQVAPHKPALGALGLKTSVPQADLQSDVCLTDSCCCFMGSQHMFAA